MKYRITAVLSVVLLLCTLQGTSQLYAQHTKHLNREISQFEQKKVKSRLPYVGDLTARQVKVVLAGDNSMADLLLKNFVEKGWYITSYEYCSYQEFDKIKSDTNYYFLMRINKFVSKNNSSDYMEYLTFFKGSEKTTDQLEDLCELISLPMYPNNDTQGRIFTYLPAYINIIQKYIQQLSDGERLPIVGKEPVASRPDPSKRVLFIRSDFGYDIQEEDLNEMFNGKAVITSEEEVERALENGREDCLVSLIVAPSEIPSNGKSYCYKMLISTDTYELYYFAKHNLRCNKNRGFLKKDIRKISSRYR